MVVIEKSLRSLHAKTLTKPRTDRRVFDFLECANVCLVNIISFNQIFEFDMDILFIILFINKVTEHRN